MVDFDSKNATIAFWNAGVNFIKELFKIFIEFRLFKFFYFYYLHLIIFFKEFFDLVELNMLYCKTVYDIYN